VNQKDQEHVPTTGHVDGIISPGWLQVASPKEGKVLIGSQRWLRYKSNKVPEVSAATTQGFESNVWKHWQQFEMWNFYRGLGS